MFSTPANLIAGLFGKLLSTSLTFSALALATHLHAAPVVLGSFNVDIGETSVSGLSSGGFMAVQFSVAYSSVVKGAGIVAGGPYYCAQGDLDIAMTKCSCTGLALISTCKVAPGATDVPRLISYTERQAQDREIDRTSHMARQKIWMFSGTRDSVVPPAVMGDLRSYFRHYIPDQNILFRAGVPAEHAMPTDAYGEACSKLGKPFINNCGVDAAGELLQWIYGVLQPRQSGQLRGRLVEFDQSEFVPDRRPEDHGLDYRGFAYVPAACNNPQGQKSQPCRLHVALHGCRQNVENVDATFVRHAGYNPWADTNNIIVLYPQTRATFGRNPNACWNWFNYDGTDPDYASRRGVQMAALKSMVDRVAGLSAPPPFSVTCTTASNAEHVAAGRARARFFLVFATGSDRLLGINTLWMASSLKQAGPNYYLPDSCL